MLSKKLISAGLAFVMAASLFVTAGVTADAKFAPTSNTQVATDGTRTVTQKSTDSRTGTVTVTVTITKPDGSKEIQKTETKADGAETYTVNKTAVSGEQETVIYGTTTDGRDGIITGTYDKTGEKTTEALYFGSGGDMFLAHAKVKTTSFKVPDTIVVKGKSYKIIEVSDEVFMGNKKLKKIELGKNVRIIGSDTFRNVKNLKTVIVNNPTTDIDTGAFKGIDKNAVIKIKAKGDDFTKTKKAIVKSGAPKTAKFKKI